MGNVNSVGKSTYSNFRQPIGLAKIIVPSDVDRDLFVNKCLHLSVVSILSEQETPIHNVICPGHLLRELKFPITYQSHGSAVLYGVDGSSNQVYIIAVLDKVDEISGNKENSYHVQKFSDNSKIIFSIDPDENLINISLVGKTQSKFLLNLTNADSLVRITANGQVEINATDKVTVHSNHVEIKTDLNEIIIDQDAEEIRLNSENVIIGDGSQAALLGNLFMDLYMEFIDQIAASTITTSIGQMPLLNKEKIIEYKEKFKETLSARVKLY